MVCSDVLFRSPVDLLLLASQVATDSVTVVTQVTVQRGFILC